MDGVGPQPAPDDVPRSPSGRVPQWVLDEANGRTSLPTGWRAPAESGLPSRPAAAAQLATGSDRGGGRSPGCPRGRRAVARLERPAEGRRPVGCPSAGSRGGCYAPWDPADGPARPSWRCARPRDFLNTSRQGVPVTFSPCRPIHFVVRPDNTPRGGDALLASAFMRLSAVTGLTVINDGPTDEPATLERDPYQPDRYGNRWAPVLVAWATEEEVPDFGRDTVGRAGPILSPSATELRDTCQGWCSWTRRRSARSGPLMGRPRRGRSSSTSSGTSSDWTTPPGTTNSCTRTTSPEETDYAAGDLAGLARLGAGSCQPDLSNLHTFGLHCDRPRTPRRRPYERECLRLDRGARGTRC